MKQLYIEKSKFHMLIMTMLLLMSFFIPSYPVYALDNDILKDDEVVRTIDKMNDLRKTYNIPLLSYNDSLNKTALTHNKYMRFNSSYSSIEESGKLYYRGRYPWDRATYNGYANSYVFELLAKDTLTFTDGLNQLLKNPYARYNILDPLYTDMGMDSYNGYTTYLLGGVNRTKSYEIVYPYNKQMNIDTVFENKYIIDPYNQLSTKPEVKGVPITYSIYSSDARVIEYDNLKVKLINTQTNESVKTEVITSNDDRNLTSTIMILPLEEYNLGTTYKVTITADLGFSSAISFDGSSFWHKRYVNYSGTFTTRSMDVSSNQFEYITREKFVVDLIKASSFSIRDSLEIIFPDVNIQSPNYKYIYTAYINKIVNGYGDGLYRPTANITREQAYTLLIRSYEKQVGLITLSENERNLIFSDRKSISSYAIEPIYKAKKIGILIDNQYAFLPGTYISINEFQQIMERYENVIK